MSECCKSVRISWGAEYKWTQCKMSFSSREAGEEQVLNCPYDPPDPLWSFTSKAKERLMEKKQLHKQPFSCPGAREKGYGWLCNYREGSCLCLGPEITTLLHNEFSSFWMAWGAPVKQLTPTNLLCARIQGSVAFFQEAQSSTQEGGNSVFWSLFSVFLIFPAHLSLLF